MTDISLAKTTSNPMFHDTHVHLDMLLSKLNFLPDGRLIESLPKEEFEFELSQLDLSDSATKKLHTLLNDHEFVCQSTVSTKNYLHVSKLFYSFPQVKYFVGSHPDIVDEKFELQTYLDYQAHAFVNFAIAQNIIGVGEIGLDYYHCKDSQLQDIQKKLFESQILLAINLDLPIMIHCRDAFVDLFEILERYPQIHGRFLVHCFTSNSEDMFRVVALGGKVAFGGVCTFASAKELQDAVSQCPTENFVLETDLPFLAPIRGEICLPNMVDLVAQKVADLKGLSKDEIWKLSRDNTVALFPKIIDHNTNL